MQLGVCFKDLELVYSKAYETKRQQTYRGQVLMLAGWEVSSYTIIPSLPERGHNIDNLLEASGLVHTGSQVALKLASPDMEAKSQLWSLRKP